MSIKIEAETELQLVCNNVDQSLVKKETPECEVSKSDGNDETSVELGNDSSCNLADNSLSNKKDSTEEIVSTLKEESQSEKKDLPVIPVLSKSAMKKLKKKALWAQQKKERRFSYYSMIVSYTIFNYNSTSGLEKRRKGRKGGLILLVV